MRFYNLAGTLVDPPSPIYQRVKSPAGTTSEFEYGTDPEVVKSSTGVYYMDYTLPDTGGVWITEAEAGQAGVTEKVSMFSKFFVIKSEV